MKKEFGYLMLTAAVIIVIFGILSATLVSMFILTGIGTAHLDAAKNALFLAESGLQVGKKNLPDLNNPQTCATLSNTTSLATGSFTVGGETAFGSSQLLGNILKGDTPTTLQINNSAGLSTFGWVMIGSEMFTYYGNNLLGTLFNVQRAQYGTSAVDHSDGDLVSQYQCVITSTGNSPENNPLGTRKLQLSISPGTILYTVGSGGTILNWDGKAWGAQASPFSFQYNEVSILNYHTGWAVANNGLTQNSPQPWFFRIAKLTTNGWADSSFQNELGVNLNAVFTTSDKEAWAVGDRLLAGGPGPGNKPTILRWTASNGWCLSPIAPATSSCGAKPVSVVQAVSQRFLYAVKVLDTDGDGFGNFGIAAGGQTGTGTAGLILEYNGTQWTPISMAGGSYAQLSGLDIIANGNNTPKELFIVGNKIPLGNPNQPATNGVILRRQNNVWTEVTAAKPLIAVSMLDTDSDGIANFGMAVGTEGMVYYYNGSSWTAMAEFSASIDLTSVIVLSTTEAWAVATNGNRYHYNGSTWTLRNTGAGAANLNSISGLYASPPNVSFWSDVIK